LFKLTLFCVLSISRMPRGKMC